MAECTSSRSRISSKTFDEEFLTCRLCEQQFNDSDRVPKVLTCMHTMCNVCLQLLIQDSHVLCPYCKRKWVLPEEGFPNHYMLSNLREYRCLIRETPCAEEGDEKGEDEKKKCSCCPSSEEVNEAVGFCNDCGGYVCQLCIDHHKLLRQLKDHDIHKLSELHGCVFVRKARCNLHPDQDLTVYCKTCLEAVCHTCCALTEHEGHQKIDLNLALADTKRDLRVLAAKGRARQAPLVELSASIDAVINDLNMICISREQDIQALFDDLESVIKAQCNTAQTVLRDLCQSKTKQLQKQKSEVEYACAEYESACEFSEQACRIANPIQLLASQSQISNRLNELINTDKDIVEFTEPVENTFIQFQPSHTTSVLTFRSIIANIGLVRSSTTLPSLCKVTSIPSQLYVGGDLQQGETELALVRTASFNTEVFENTTGGDPLSAYLIDPDGSQKECQVTDNEDGSYAVGFTPTALGKHRLDIMLFDRPIRDSPFDINVESNYQLPPFDYISWLPAVAGFPHTVTVNLPEDSGEPVAKATSLNVAIESASGQTVLCTVTQPENVSNVYVIQYTPPTADQLTLMVNVCNKPLGNSPYNIEVADFSKENTEISFEIPVANQRWMISVLPKDSQGRPVNISRTILRLKVNTLRINKDLKIAAHQVTSDHIHIFHCIPHKVGIHQVDAMVHGVSVKGKSIPVTVEMSLVLLTPGDKDSSPTSVATSPSGVIFVSDTKMGSIHIHNIDGSYSNISVNIRKSSQIAIDHLGRLFLLVSGGRRVHVYNAQGDEISAWKCTRDNNKPACIACSRRCQDDVVIIGDSSPGFNGLFLYKSDGTPIKCVGLSSNFFIEGQDSVCVDDRNHIFICHSTRSKVVEFNVNGLFIREFSTQVKGSQLAITSTTHGFILISDKERIYILDMQSGFVKSKGYIHSHGSVNNSIAATTDGCVIALSSSQKRLVKYGYII